MKKDIKKDMKKDLMSSDEVQLDSLTKQQEYIIQRDLDLDLVDHKEGMIKSAYLLKSKNLKKPLVPDDYVQMGEDRAFIKLANGDLVSVLKVCEYLEDCQKTEALMKQRKREELAKKF